MAIGVEELGQVVSALAQRVDVLAARLDVALGLLAEARLSGSPDNQALLDDLIERAEAAVGADPSTSVPRAGRPAFTADEDEPTASHAIAVASTGQSEPGQSEPGHSDHGQSEQFLDHTTRRDRQTARAVDVLESLTKRK